MNLTTAPLGYAFEGDYPESYGGSRDRLQQVLARQLAELDNSDGEAELLGILRGRRCGHQELPQLDLRRRRDGTHALIARGEIVMPSASYDDKEVQGFLEAGRFAKDDPAGQPGHCGLVRVRQPLVSLPVVERIIDQCGGRGARAWPNYLATMAAVGKGIGGPEPLDDRGVAFADYRIASAAEHHDKPAPAVAVIDTGVPAAERTIDGWLKLTHTAYDVDELDVYPHGPDGFLDFQAGHGAFVAGIVQRVAPQAEVRMYRAADTDGFATDQDIAEALLRAHRDKAKIINLSLGGRTVDNQPPPAMTAAIRQIHDETGGEAVIVAAAGNFGDSAPCWPAALDGVEAVAGLTAQLTPAPWSSYGPAVAFSAVAEGIRSTFPTGNESPVFDAEPESFGPDAWALWSGTSFAAPQVAGAIARICQEHGCAPRKAVELLADRGKDIAGYGKAMRILEGFR
jgi:hypothetical protein